MHPGCKMDDKSPGVIPSTKLISLRINGAVRVDQGYPADSSLFTFMFVVSFLGSVSRMVGNGGGLRKSRPGSVAELAKACTL